MWQHVELPPHPQPSRYRSFLYEMAAWIELNEERRWEGIVVSNGGSLKKQLTGGSKTGGRR